MYLTEEADLLVWHIDISAVIKVHFQLLLLIYTYCYLSMFHWPWQEISIMWYSHNLHTLFSKSLYSSIHWQYTLGKLLLFTQYALACAHKQTKDYVYILLQSRWWWVMWLVLGGRLWSTCTFQQQSKGSWWDLVWIVIIHTRNAFIYNSMLHISFQWKCNWFEDIFLISSI